MNKELFESLEALCVMWEKNDEKPESVQNILDKYKLLKENQIDSEKLKFYEDWVKKPRRFYYSTVGYGVFSLFGEKYRMGRVEIFDKEDESGYQVDEGSYSLPFEAAVAFENWMDSLETDLPIHIEVGNHKWCADECAKSLGFEDDEDMRNPDKVKEYRRKKNDEHARQMGYKYWDDLLANSKWTKKQN